MNKNIINYNNFKENYIEKDTPISEDDNNEDYCKNKINVFSKNCEKNGTKEPTNCDTYNSCEEI